MSTWPQKSASRERVRRFDFGETLSASAGLAADLDGFEEIVGLPDWREIEEQFAGG